MHKYSRIALPGLLTAGLVLVLAFFAYSQLGGNDGREQVTNAWQNARKAGGYHFRADIVEQAVPLAQNPQQFYTTWNNNALRMAWAGANWDGEGDLFVYLDTGAGPTTNALYNPYPLASVNEMRARSSAVAAANIQLPAGFNARYLVWVLDTQTATLMQWNGGWQTVRTLAPSEFRLNSTVSPVRTDILLSFNTLGLNAASALKLVAVATEENALELWAAAPDKNPLNSPRVLPA